MPLSSKASNIVQNIFCLYDVTGFTQLWHSIPGATECKAHTQHTQLFQLGYLAQVRVVREPVIKLVRQALLHQPLFLVQLVDNHRVRLVKVKHAGDQHGGHPRHRGPGGKVAENLAEVQHAGDRK